MSKGKKSVAEAAPSSPDTDSLEEEFKDAVNTAKKTFFEVTSLQLLIPESGRHALHAFWLQLQCSHDEQPDMVHANADVATLHQHIICQYMP